MALSLDAKQLENLLALASQAEGATDEQKSSVLALQKQVTEDKLAQEKKQLKQTAITALEEDAQVFANSISELMVPAFVKTYDVDFVRDAESGKFIAKDDMYVDIAGVPRSDYPSAEFTALAVADPILADKVLGKKRASVVIQYDEWIKAKAKIQERASKVILGKGIQIPDNDSASIKLVYNSVNLLRIQNPDKTIDSPQFAVKARVGKTVGRKAGSGTGTRKKVEWNGVEYSTRRAYVITRFGPDGVDMDVDFCRSLVKHGDTVEQGSSSINFSNVGKQLEKAVDETDRVLTILNGN